MIKFFAFFTLLVALFPTLTSGAGKKLPIPRFVSIKSDEVNARKGPGVQYPVEWVFVKKTEPVEIIEEYDQWRKIRDINDEGGWVHVRTLTGRRNVVIVGDESVCLKKSINLNSKIIANLSPKLRCVLRTCEKDFCKIKCREYQGWVPKKNLWGVYKNEIL